MSEPRGNRTFLWIAGVSVALNLVLVGLFGGLVLRPPAGEPAAGSPERETARTLLREASPEDRRAVRTRLARSWRQSAEERDILREAQLAVSDALLADPYDPEAAKEAFARLNAADAALRLAIQTDLAETLAAADPAARAQLAERYSRRANRPRSRDRPGDR